MISRRAVLAGGCLAVAAVAGCLDDSEPSADSGGPDPDDDRRLITVTDGSTEVEAVSYGDVSSVGAIDDPEQMDGPVVPVVLTDEGVASFRDALDEIDGLDSPDSVDIELYADNALINSFGLAPGLADSIAAGEWDGEFIVVTDSREEAETLRDSLLG